jgi:hypothetical protein
MKAGAAIAPKCLHAERLNVLAMLQTDCVHRVIALTSV